MADKRKTGRRIKRLHAKILFEGEERRGISSNFSLSGLFIKSRKKFKPGSTVNITLDVGDNREMVKSSKPDREKKTSAFDKFNEGMGISLTEAPHEYKGFLKDLVQEHL
jgi:hypothetical protein